MNNLLSYCGLIDLWISASDKNLPVNFKAKAKEPDEDIEDNIVESLKDSETLDKT